MPTDGTGLIQSLCRIKVAGNSQTHTVQLYRADNLTTPVLAVSIDTTQAANLTVDAASFICSTTPTVGAFPYDASFNGTSNSYFLVSHETSGGDQWYSNDTTFTHASTFSWGEAIYRDSPCTSGAFGTDGTNIFGPVNFTYSIP